MEITLKELMELAASSGKEQPQTPFVVGDAYLIRTVTMTWTGRVSRIVGFFLVLEDAAWIADTGRFGDATHEDALAEVEPRDGPAIVNMYSIVDACDWLTDLPRKQK